MALSEGQFKDLEKRLLAFKAQFGITHTAQSLISAEKFATLFTAEVSLKWAGKIVTSVFR